MTLELEKSYKSVIYQSNKKSYVNENKSGKIDVKGLGYNKFTLDFRE